jgi:hypothetical protein
MFYKIIFNDDQTILFTDILEGCISIIETDLYGICEDQERKYIIIPVWLTEEEYYNLPQFDLD